MYVGRIVIIGRSQGRSWVAYRVSSRSFPNRRAEVRGGAVLVSPIDPADLRRNPYIAYNCIQLLEDAAVVANGTHADMIAERMAQGFPPLEAVGLSLLAYGYERDELKTPRIAGVVSEDRGYLGIARDSELRVKEYLLHGDCAFHVATYEAVDFQPIELAAADAGSLAKAAFLLPYERPVCAAAAMGGDLGFHSDVYNP